MFFLIYIFFFYSFFIISFYFMFTSRNQVGSQQLAVALVLTFSLRFCSSGSEIRRRTIRSLIRYAHTLHLPFLELLNGTARSFAQLAVAYSLADDLQDSGPLFMVVMHFICGDLSDTLFFQWRAHAHSNAHTHTCTHTYMHLKANITNN